MNPPYPVQLLASMLRTPRGTLPLRTFFASGISTDSGGETSSSAIQAIIRRLYRN